MTKIIVITGASAGIGKATAEMLKKEGHKVYSLSRRDIPGILYIKTDVSKYEEVKRAIDEIIYKEGRIDILINNAGMGISGAIENTDVLDAEKLFDINFFGLVFATKEVLPHMRKNGGGLILNISSVAAKFSLPFQSYYSASKAAVSSFSDALRLEVRPFNIKVSSLLPGDVKTDFTASRVKNKSNDPTYGDRVDKSVRLMEREEQNGMSSTFIAKKIVKLINKKNPPPYIVAGSKYALLVFIIRFLPHRIVLSLLGRIYG